jgi:GntR family transcriptional regulator, N-acetylglucosamine utilization regulator
MTAATTIRARGSGPGTQASARTAGLSELRQSDGRALHYQIKEALTLQISAGHWKPDQELPTEEELCRHYGVSRGTVRRAIADLVQQGLVYRKQGRGTYVSSPKLEGSILGSYKLYRANGVPHDAGAKVLRCELHRANNEVRRILQLRPRSEVYELERIRFVQGVPVSLQLSYLPAQLCPGLHLQDLTHRHLYDVLRQDCGVSLLRAEEYVEPVLADEYVAERLGIAPGAPIFLVERHSYSFGDRVAEFRRASMRGDLYRYRIDLR